MKRSLIISYLKLRCPRSVDDEARNTLIMNTWSVETPRYPSWLQGVWQSHSRHANLKKVSNQEGPKHPEVLGRAIRRAPHREAFIPDIKSWVSGAGWQGYKSTSAS
jgi:hypothetical protein